VSYEVAVPPDEVTAMTSTLQAAKADTSTLTSSINAELATSVGVAITGAIVTSVTAPTDGSATPTPKPVVNTESSSVAAALLLAAAAFA
jgi:hypothetical protein